jgi:hypothetical protein
MKLYWQFQDLITSVGALMQGHIHVDLGRITLFKVFMCSDDVHDMTCSLEQFLDQNIEKYIKLLFSRDARKPITIGMYLSFYYALI